MAVLTLPVILTSMDITILHVAIPTISRELAPSSSQMLWILDVYGFLLAGLLILMGNIGNRIGRRRILMIGGVVYVAAAMLTAFAPNPEVLIAGRALMGLGGATLIPSTLSLVRNMFPDSAERTHAIGIWTASTSGGIALGPIVGGLLLEAFWWGSVFLIHAPIIVLFLIATPLLVPEYKNRASARLDLFSVGLSFAAILPSVWAIKTAAEELAMTLQTWAALGVGLLAGAIFLFRQGRISQPLVDVSLFANPRFTGAVLGAGLAMFGLVGVMFYFAQYLQLVAGLSPLIAGVAILPIVVGVGSMAVLSSLLVRRFGYPRVFGAGAAVAAAGILVFSRTPADGGLVLAIIASAFIGAGIAPMATLTTDIVVGTAPPRRSGAAAALEETAAEFGSALGIAVLGTIGTVVYRSRILDGVPDDIPEEATEALSSNLGAALGVAEQLSGDAAEHLTALAQQSFVDGLGAATIVGSCILLVAAVICPILIHRGRNTTQSVMNPDEKRQRRDECSSPHKLPVCPPCGFPGE
ncbi:MFS transporter [Nesterenkonia muleiensis]|uniref:MFS transporter n=1 Tax=Nesterenkonia muleiensis TaxID=2282648 RepID=UPI001EE3E36F|nr:MFS transporter [Nesterenkonia muleiensis]